MAQAQAARFNNIIDLTEEDDDDDQLENLSEAATKAQAAANRLTSQLQSITSASTVVQNATLNGQILSGNRAVGSTANGIRTKPGEGTITGTQFHKSDDSIRSPSMGPRMGTFGPRGTIHTSARPMSARSDQSETPETSKDNTATNDSAVRLQMAGAEYAGRNITKTYDMQNPLQAPEDASFLRPKRPGRPTDQWASKWTSETSKPPSNYGTDKHEKLDQSNKGSVRSATSRVSLSPPESGSNESASNVARPISAPPAKRKRSSASPQLDVLAKSARRETSNSRYSSGIPGSLEDGKSITPSNGRPDTVHTAQYIRGAIGAFGKRDHGLLTPGLDDHDWKTVSRQNFMLSSTENGPLFEIFKTIIYPALKRAKKSAKQALSEDELISIGKSVAIEVVAQKLKAYVSQSSLKPDDAQREDLEQFVTKRFREKVQEAVQRSDATRSASEARHHLSIPERTNGSEPNLGKTSKPSANIALRTSAQAGLAAKMPTNIPQQTALSSTFKLAAPGASAAKPSKQITDLSSYLQKLEKEVLPTDLDEFDHASPVRAQASISGAAEEETVNEPSSHQQPPTSMTDADLIVYDSLNDHALSMPALSPASLPVSAIAQDDPKSPLELPFPSGYDRGRYPAQRRKRGNKYFTPTARASESVTSNDSKPSVPASQPSQPAPVKKHEAGEKTQARSATVASQVSEDLVSQMLIARVATDPNAKALLEVIASGTTSQLHKAEFQALLDELNAAQQSQGTGDSPGSAVHSAGLRRNSNGSRRTDTSGDLGRSSFSSSSHRIVESLPPTEKDQVRLLKALANRPGGSQASYKGADRQQNGRWIKGVPRAKPRTSESAARVAIANTGSFVSQSDATLDSSPSTPHMRGTAYHPKIHAPSQRKVNHVKKRLRPTASAVVGPQTVEQPFVSRSPATAFDPHLERLVAVLVVNGSGNAGPWKKKDRHFIDYTEQEELLGNDTVLRLTHAVSREQETELPNASIPNFTRIETKVRDPTRRPERHIPSLLRHRELGSDTRGRNVDIRRELRLRRFEMIEPWRYWKGASGDIVTAAWGLDSKTYAVGAAAHTNPEDVQYNRPCNLLLGDLIQNTLTELPDHRVDRPKPETLADTYNARQAVYEACDPMVYETVSHIAFSPTAERMYTASHDRTVKIWDTSVPQQCLTTLQHDAHVTSVEVSAHRPGLFATGSAVIENAVRIYYNENDYLFHVDFSSSRAVAKPAWKIHPECLRWGSTAFTSHLLLAGFHQNDTDEPSQEGQLCLWDANAFQFVKVLPSSQSVLAAAWHPTLNFFATGGAPGGNLLTDKYKTKTVVRTWDLRTPTHYTMEYECSALDMQDITFHPIDSNIVTAGCTDGTSFVWDYRRPDYPLHRLRHGMPLVDWDHTRGSREEVDTGVMMSLWAPGGSLFYTGSSDGMIKEWDVRRHPQDVMVRNVAQFGAGIQSGAFSPDGTNLLVGDADGGVHVLSSAPCGPQPLESGSDDVSPELPIILVRAPDGSGLALDMDDDDPGCEGREAAKDLKSSGQIIFDRDFGVTQGPSYKIPYAEYARREAVDPDAIRSHAKKSAEAKQFFLRTREENKEVEDKRRGMIAARRQRIAQLYPESKAAKEEQIRTSQRGFSGDPFDRSTSYHSEHDRSVLARGEGSFDQDGDYPMLDVPPSNQRPPSKWDSILGPLKWTGARGHSVPNLGKVEPPVVKILDADVEDNTIPESEMIEQNDWWPRLNEDEIERARKLPQLKQKAS